MANQMIALQSRAPQLPDPSRLTTQYANMMNMVQQNETSKRQAERAQQEMDYATAEETRKKDLHGPALTKAQLDNAVKALELFREQVGDVDENDIAAKEAVRADLVARIPGYDQFIPPASQWTRDTIERLMMDSDKEIDKLYATPVASLEVDVDGNPRSVTVGGLNPQQSPVYDAPPPMANAPRATPTAPQAAPANPMSPGYKPNTAAADPGSLSLVINSALETGVMAKADFDKMLSLAPPESRAKITAWAQQNNIQVTPDVPGVTDNQMRGAPNEMRASPMSYDGQTPESQFAVYRGDPMQSQTAGLRGAPPMEQTLAQTQPRTITKLQRRDPNVSPYPGSARVPIERVRAEAQAGRPSPAEEAAKKKATTQVEIEMAPDLAKATKNAERIYQLKSEAPKERNVASRLIANIDDRIETIDRLLRNPDRRLINGPIEGNIPYRLQFGPRADAQADFDKIKNTDTLTSLVEMKQDSPTGGSPVGNASNADVVLVAKGANSLIQTGTLPKMDEELKRIRAQLYRTRSNAIKFYNDTYGDVVAADPRLKLTVPAIADRYISSKDLAKPRTSTKVDRNNPLLRGN